MILTDIIAKNKKQALKIVDILMQKRLLLHAAISKKIIYHRHSETGQLIRKKQTLIIGKTKALLFNEINKELKNQFTENMPLLYAVPIVYMDEELATILRSNTAKI